MKVYHLISVLLLCTINLNDKSLSVNILCEKNGKIRPNFDEIFGQKWENENSENSNWQSEQNANYYQNNQNELNHSIGSDLNDQKKHEIVHKFHAIKEGIKKRGKYSEKNRNKIEQKIGVKLGISRQKIYKWKKEFGIYEKNYYEIKKQEFIERIDAFKRMSKYGKQKKFAEELGIHRKTFRNWKKEFGIKCQGNAYSNEEKTVKMNLYYKKKKENSSLSDKEIVGILKIGSSTLKRWKKEKKF